MSGASDKPVSAYDPATIDWEAVQFWRSVPPMEKVVASLRLEDIRRQLVTACIRRDHPEFTERQVLDAYREWLDSPEAFDFELRLRRVPRTLDCVDDGSEKR